jgi:hypothetical protein
MRLLGLPTGKPLKPEGVQDPNGSKPERRLIIFLYLSELSEGAGERANPVKLLAGDGRLERQTFGSGDHREYHTAPY